MSAGVAFSVAFRCRISPSPRFQARKQPTLPKSSRRKLKFRPPPTPHKEASPPHGLGGNATTYTRLPTRNEEASSPPIDFLGEVKLSDLVAAAAGGTQEESYDFDSDGSEEDEVEEKVCYGFEAEDGDEHWESELEESEDGGDVKEKGVPAVMRCFDTAKIFVKAGNGGNGVVAFRREKYVPLGGPSGGDGGRGGNVYLEVDASMNSLLPFRKSVHFRAGRGAHGQGRNQDGAKGEDVVVKVPPGTVAKDAESEVVLLELLSPGQRALLLPGGRGGRGNAAFKSGTNKVPKIAEKGEEGAEMCVPFSYCLFHLVYMF